MILHSRIVVSGGDSSYPVRHETVKGVGGEDSGDAGRGGDVVGGSCFKATRTLQALL